MLTKREPDIKYGEYEKNARPLVNAGTKFVQVVWGFDYWTANVLDESMKAQGLAWKLAREKYGNFRHEDIECLVVFFTVQILVEFRVRPES